MDVLLASVSLDTLRVLPWVFAVLVGGLWFYISFSGQKRYWEIVVACLQGLLAAIVSFLLLNFGIAAYILSNLTDPRWSVGKGPLITANELSSSVPFIADIVKVLNDTQNEVVGAVNNVGRMQNSLNVAGEFLLAAGKTMIAALIIALILLYVAKKWAPKQKKKRDAAQLSLEKTAEAERRRRQAADNAYRDKRIAAIEEHFNIEPPAREG